MKDRNARLLDEVHTLAKVYHWSEAVILGLSGARRQAYLLRIERDRDAALLEVLREGY
ncbi:MAG: hypothetical protein JST91_12690 [Actinobacteria bacterium]|nr:hypothetical protein [Actinomycetota bacterium]